MAYKPKTCDQCGATFEPTMSRQKRCSPECAQAKRREYNQRPERKAKELARRQSLQHKAKQREYKQRPEVKAKQRERMREYNQRPERKAKQREYFRKYDQRPERKAKQREYDQQPARRESKNARWRARYHLLGGKGYRRAYRSLYVSQAGTCGLCGQPVAYADGDVDHKVPVAALEGLGIPADIINGPANLHATHKSCNCSKGAKILPQFAVLFAELLTAAKLAGYVQGDLFA